MKIKTLLLLLFILSVIDFAVAQDTAEPAKEKPVTPHEFVTHHKMEAGKEIISYTAIAGETILKDDEENPTADIFSIAYIKDGVDPTSRSITFIFNGGPGSSSIWLHLGAFGPKHVSLSDDPVNPGGPPYKLVDNPNTLLRYSDLVFVDPVGTGYSHAAGKKKDADFWGVDEDAASISQFIRRFLTKNNRWNSPKYLAGESYGTIRASVLIRDLELKLLDSVTFDGVILLSTALDVRTFVTAGPGNEIPYVTNLPTYAATAYYHNALPEKPADLDKFLQDCREFASGEYLEALFRGDSLPADHAAEIVKKLHYFTGLSEEYIQRTHLRIDSARFQKELLRSRGLTIGIHDTRYTGKDLDEAGEQVQLDPFLLSIAGPFVATLNSYLSSELNVKMDQQYIAFSLPASGGWKRPGGSGAFDGFLYTANYLAQAAATNKDFKVFVASGIHDLATGFFATEYIFAHSGIPKEQVVLKNYYGGHMMYMYGPSLQQMIQDLGAFMKR